MIGKLDTMKVLRRLVVPLIVAVVGMVLLFAVEPVTVLLTDKPLPPSSAFTTRREFLVHLSNGWEKVDAMHYDDAEVTARAALLCAETRETKARAAYLIGVTHARRIGRRNEDALVAWQYLSAAESLTVWPEVREPVWDEMVRVAEAMGDVARFESVAARIGKSSTNTVLRESLDMRLLDLAIARGGWRDMTNAVSRISPPAPRTAAAFQYDRRMVTANERLLRDPEWFKARCAAQPERSAALLRTETEGEVGRIYRRLFAAADAETRPGLLLDFSRFLFDIGRYKEAMGPVQEYLAGSSTSRADEALELLTHLQVKFGEIQDAAKTAETLVRRNRLTAELANMVCDLSDSLEKTGQGDRALVLLRSAVKPDGDREIERPVVKMLVQVASRNGRSTEAKTWYEKLKQAAPNAGDLAGVALTAAWQMIAQSDWTNAMHWLGWYVEASPGHEVNAEALYAMQEVLLGLEGQGLPAMTYGTAALRAGSSCPRAVKAMQSVGETLEKLGIHISAERYYSRAALMGYIRGGNHAASGRAALMGYIRGGNHAASGRAVNDMALRRGRCMVKDGRLEDADQVLREVCANADDPAVRSEAAAWWAIVAFGLGQRLEGQRRSALADPALLAPDVVARVAIARDLPGLSTGSNRVERASALLRNAAALPPDERTATTRRIFAETLERMRAAGDYDGILRLCAAEAPALTNMVSAEKIAIHRAEAVVNAQGIDALVSMLEKDAATTNAPPFIVGLRNELADMQTLRREASSAVRRSAPDSPREKR